MDAVLSESINIQTVLSHHTLPDTTPFLPMVFTYNNEKTGISNPRMMRSKFRSFDDFNISVAVFIIHIMYKCIPERCYSRCHESGLVEACKESPHLFDFVAKIMLASVLGIYKTARVKASTKTRRFVLPLIQGGLEMETWLREICSTNGEMLLLFTKEYFYEMIERCHGIKLFFAYQYDWETLRKRQIALCDIIRAQINDNFEKRVPSPNDYGILFENVKARLATEKHADDIPKQRVVDIQVKNPIDYINNLFLEFSLTHYEVDDSKIRSGFEYELPDPLPRGQIPIKTRALMKKFMQDLRSLYVEKHGVRSINIMPMQWLAIFDVRVDRLISFRKLMYLRTTKLRDELPLLTTYEFALLYTFFAIHAEMDIYFEYPLDAYKYARHIDAAVSIMKLNEGDRFPEKTLGQTYACDNCKGIKNQALHQTKRSNSKIHGQPVTTVKLDDYARVLCGNRPSKAQWKHTHYEKYGYFPSGPSKTINETQHDRNGKMRKKTKKIMLQHTAQRCTLYQARILNAFGRDIVYNNIAYFMCYGCTKLTPYECVNVYGIDLVCDDCIRYCEMATKCESETCEYCGITTHTKQLDRRYAFYLFDDMEPVLEKQKWRMMYFCKEHGQMAWMKQHRFTTKSIAMTGLRNKWYMRDKDNKVIEIGSVPYGRCESAFYDNRMDDVQVENNIIINK